jgi:ribosomal peptide maturation radical SAM protein 1
VLARLLKARAPGVRVLFGGANCEGPMGTALHRAFSWLDAVVRGEAERVLPGLVRDLLAGGPVTPVPGLCWRDEAGRSVSADGAGEPVAMDDVPLPVYDEYFERLETTRLAPAVRPRVTLLYEGARGCWWGARSTCTFCGLNGDSMAFRSKAPARVLDEIGALAARHRRTSFQIVDNIVDPRYLREVFPRLAEAGHDLSIFLETKANLRKDQVRLLHAAGVRFVNPGIESLSTPILRLMRKGVTAYQNLRLLKWCAEIGIRCHWNLLYGFPGEPAEEYGRMADLVPSIVHLDSPRLTPLRLDRFSPYHQAPAAHGIAVGEPLPHYRLLYRAAPELVRDLAYSFEFTRADGADPEAHVAPLRAALAAWDDALLAGSRGSLRLARGPGFVVVRDRRPGLPAADYTFDDVEGRLYLACADGATAAQAWERAVQAPGRTDVTVDDVAAFLDDLVDQRLAYAEDGRYLALAI